MALIAAPALAYPPSVVTGSADVAKSTATIHGSVNPLSQPTQYWVEFGVSGFGQRGPNQSLPGSSDLTNITVKLNNLNPGKTWMYRVVAQNADGINRGDPKTFVTPNSAPTATTQPAGAVTQSGATVAAIVNNTGAASSVAFEYGLTTAYGATSAAQPVGASTSDQTVSQALTGLAADTLYHYRVVQQVSGTTVRGADSTFTTARIPNGLLLQVSANVVTYNGTVDVFGVLAGSQNTGKTIHIQADPFPFEGNFAEVASGQTDATGAFRIAVSPLLQNAVFRAVADTNPVVTSQNVTVSVPLQATLNVGAKKVAKGTKVRFFGQVTPTQAGTQVLIQTQRGGRWVTVSTTRTGARSAFTTKVAIKAPGNYRAMVQPVDGSHVPGTSPSRRIRVGR